MPKTPQDRIGDPNERADDQDLELSLRPRRFSDFVGQRVAKEQLEIFVEAAKQRGETLDHVLFAGPPGLGKTTLAGILAHEMGVGIHITSGPAWSARATSPACSRTSRRATSSSSTRSTASTPPSRRACIPAMEDFGSTS